MYDNYYIIGVGGIGSNLVPMLVKFLGHTKNKYTLTLIDGDNVEEKNLVRQKFRPEDIGRFKVEASNYYVPNVETTTLPIYINNDNIKGIIKDDSIVILCVDNNKTRKLVQEHCLTLKNVILVNGGNETYDGDVTVFRSLDGEIIMPPIWDGQPQITDPKDKHPSEKSCEARYEDDPQLFTTNISVATNILEFLTPVVLKKEILWRRKWFDIRSGSRVESHLKPQELVQFQLS